MSFGAESVATGNATWGVLPSTSASTRELPAPVLPSRPSPGDRMPRDTEKGTGGMRAPTFPAAPKAVMATPFTNQRARLLPLLDLDSNTSAAVSALRAT